MIFYLHVWIINVSIPMRTPSYTEHSKIHACSAERRNNEVLLRLWSPSLQWPRRTLYLLPLLTHSTAVKWGSASSFDDPRWLELAIVDSRTPQCLLRTLSGHSAKFQNMQGGSGSWDKVLINRCRVSAIEQGSAPSFHDPRWLAMDWPAVLGVNVGQHPHSATLALQQLIHWASSN